MSVHRGIDETQAHYFQARSLTELGAEVDGFIASDLGDWKLEGVSLDSSVGRVVRSFAGKPVFTSVLYEAVVTLTRWRHS